ncbi:hypothetical protein SNE40_010689 [Patella caerulea]|uniref:N-acetyltransferase domain-containing protein n=1 Tax=Patella caerulea TaxID=87958 RepID=A0AAN8JVL8_PATCE
MAARLVIRRATLKDYGGIMGIGSLYQGRYYLPVMYNKYLDRFNCYVGELDGEIVSFVGDRLVDADATRTIAAGRVKESYHGRGIMKIMLKSIDDSYKDVMSVKYETITATNLMLQMDGGRVTRLYTQILERECLEITGKVTNFKPYKIDSHQTKVQELKSEDLMEIFLSKDMCSKLFPGERIIPNWHPYRLLPENIPLMMDGLKFWGTKCSDQSKYTTLTVTEDFNLGEQLMYKLCVYGDDTHDMHQHAVKHIQSLNLLVKSGKYSSIMIEVSHPLDCQDAGTFLSVFEQCGLKINSYFPVNRMVLFERKRK